MWFHRNLVMPYIELVLTKLTSRVSLRGRIFMAKAWALRWRCFLLNPSSSWKSVNIWTQKPTEHMFTCLPIRGTTLKFTFVSISYRQISMTVAESLWASVKCTNTGWTRIILTSWYNLQAHHLGACAKDFQAFWLLVFPLEKNNNNKSRSWHSTNAQKPHWSY